MYQIPEVRPLFDYPSTRQPGEWDGDIWDAELLRYENKIDIQVGWCNDAFRFRSSTGESLTPCDGTNFFVVSHIFS
jgi:hypothetical protein